MQVYTKPVRIVSSNDGRKPNLKIIDKLDKVVVSFSECGRKEERAVIAPLIRDFLNGEAPVKQVADVYQTTPTACVYPRKDKEGFLGKTLRAPIVATVDDVSLRIVVTFDDEPDCIWTWESEHLNDPWDLRVTEVVAILDFVCVRADLIFDRDKGFPEDFVIDLGEQLKALGFAPVA